MFQHRKQAFRWASEYTNYNSASTGANNYGGGGGGSLNFGGGAGKLVFVNDAKLIFIFHSKCIWCLL
jgi:hypothetical protein